MNEVLSQAWRWSMQRSPILSFTRWVMGLFRPNAEAFGVLDQAALPSPIDRVIRTTVARTKLWRDERTQIARELIAHAQDALECGRAPELVVSSFGDPRRVARLLRRAMKRKRPYAWRAYRFTRCAIGCVVIVLLLGYLGLASYFYVGKPKITRNYVAQLNAQNERYQMTERAWPVYSEADIAWKRVWVPFQKELFERHAVDAEYRDRVYRFPYNSPEDPEYPEIRAKVLDYEPMLERIRDASRRPVIGAPYSFQLEQIEVAEGITVHRPGSTARDKENDQWILGLLLPHLGMLRQHANVLAFDAMLAAREQDSERAVRDLESIAHIARQCYREPFMISSMVAGAIDAMFCEITQRVLRDHPGVLNEDQLTRLAHANAISPRGWGLNLATERYFFDDFLQRAYTDDGRGNGRLTPEGAELLLELASLYWLEAQHQAKDIQAVKAAVKPALLLGVPDRRTERERYDAIFDRAEAVFESGPELIGLLQNDDELLKWQSERELLGHSASEMLLTNMNHAVAQAFRHRMYTDAASAMLAIEVYRLREGRLPDALADLPTTLLPEIPQDLFNPGESLGYRIFDDGRYALYSVGADGDDDRARGPERDNRWILDFNKRYPTVRSGSGSEEPRIELDRSGFPVLGEPEGPDGDWVIMDTRPEQHEPVAEDLP